MTRQKNILRIEFIHQGDRQMTKFKKNKNIIKLSALALVTASAPTLSSTDTVDYVQCMREKPNFRQFCYVDETKSEEKVTVPRYASVNNESLDIMPVYSTSKINILDLNGTNDRTLTFTSLSPYVKADINWVQSKECLKSDLWFDRVYLAIEDITTNEFKHIKNVSVGLNSYNENLEVFQVDGFSPWTVTSPDSSNVDIATQVFLHNADHSDDRPLAFQRIPTYCKMDVGSLRIGFDALQMSRDLDYLEVQADTTISLKTRSSVLHANYVDGQRGAICSVYNLGKSLKDIEFAWEWDDLSFDSQDLISDGVQEAVNLGTIPGSSIPNGNDYFNYFKSDAFQNNAENQCDSIPPSNYVVSTDPFMEGNVITHQQGYNNAIVHGKAHTNLVELIKAAWAINNIAVAEVDGYVQREWLTSPIVINEF